MSRVVIARDGDMVDQMAQEAYGRTSRVTEAVFEANPHLAGLPARLPVGTPVLLPDLPVVAPAKTVRLWD